LNEPSLLRKRAVRTGVPEGSIDARPRSVPAAAKMTAANRLDATVSDRGLLD
jgi:hypothetical protein